MNNRISKYFPADRVDDGKHWLAYLHKTKFKAMPVMGLMMSLREYIDKLTTMFSGRTGRRNGVESDVDHAVRLSLYRCKVTTWDELTVMIAKTVREAVYDNRKRGGPMYERKEIDCD